jgi:multidrug efflux pump subunit AcrB
LARITTSSRSLIVLVGLASKNAVLIVGFARELEF